MAISNDLKTNMAYSSKEAKLLCEGFLGDYSEVNNSSKSAIKENILLAYILPEDKYGSYWIQQLYIGEAKIADVMDNIFGYLASGTQWKASQSEGVKNIVEYAHQEILGMKGGISTEAGIAEAKYFFNCLDSLINKLENAQETIEDNNKLYVVKQTLTQLKNLNEMKEEPEEFFYYKDFTTYIYMSILNHWEIYCDYTYTYRALASIARFQKWDDTPKGRIKFCNMIKGATKNWTYD